MKDPGAKSTDDIYAAGNFNNWNPMSTRHKLAVINDSTLSINFLNVPAGVYEFKFTRGNWDKVETTSTGKDITNRVIELKGNETYEFHVEGWKDNFKGSPKKNTASSQVSIADTAFDIPQLNRKRRIWIYLPKNYSTSNKTYPVLYMQDGQNLFNEQTAPYGEWGIDEALDSLQQITGKEMIVVAIDHGGDKRMTEYNPYNNEKFGKGEGKDYVDFLATTLKPYIDKKYRTKKAAVNTSVAGSSMGGLISFYTVMRYPELFGNAGVFSPSFWIAPGLASDIKKSKFNKPHRFYFYAGSKESTTMVEDMKHVADLLKKNKGAIIKTYVSPEGQHNEQAWRKYFPGFYKWMVRN
jgi:predicted alpha/beta superfamily hydrolase